MTKVPEGLKSGPSVSSAYNQWRHLSRIISETVFSLLVCDNYDVNSVFSLSV